MWLVSYAKSMSEISASVVALWFQFQSACKSPADPEADAARLWDIASAAWLFSFQTVIKIKVIWIYIFTYI